jgi:hypothetical protein
LAALWSRTCAPCATVKLNRPSASVGTGPVVLPRVGSWTHPNILPFV